MGGIMESTNNNTVSMIVLRCISVLFFASGIGSGSCFFIYRNVSVSPLGWNGAQAVSRNPRMETPDLLQTPDIILIYLCSGREGSIFRGPVLFPPGSIKF